MINDFSKIGSNIKKQLDSKGISKQCLAERLGISEQMIDKIIKGHKAVNIKELTKIADILGIEVDELFELTDDKESLNIKFKNQCLSYKKTTFLQYRKVVTT